MIAFVKLIHIAAVAIWVGGLIALPACHRRLGQLQARPRVQGGHEMDASEQRLRDAARFAYVAIVSPAAFVAVTTGIVLIFQGGVVDPWFAVKLAFIVVLVVAHSLAGQTTARLSGKGSAYPAWRYVGATGLAGAITLATVAVSLSKPSLDGVSIPPALREPGALKTIVERVIPWR
ncbi:membrane protein [Hyphomicrobium nitrativorans NL23]|uniref:Membrane protein n=1 Tax=Hyphomicrobium nitrativorans NL23 TaxID=1029756 RepID=V5SGT8_9HYPH|nr:CopD family protein [Hyphomicrobium nitrativorans]AHB49250.1 membrane protein [Hyphomicrobium nitrativorans NL23]